jgi:hypothetical protein
MYFQQIFLKFLEFNVLKTRQHIAFAVWQIFTAIEINTFKFRVNYFLIKIFAGNKLKKIILITLFHKKYVKIPFSMQSKNS